MTSHQKWEEQNNLIITKLNFKITNSIINLEITKFNGFIRYLKNLNNFTKIIFIFWSLINVLLK